MGTTTRRGFLKRSAAALAIPYVVPSYVLGADPPSERVVVGCIGTGGRGRLDMRGLMTYGGKVVAVCDVDAQQRARAVAEVKKYYDCSAVSEKFTGCAEHGDFRELLASDAIQAVMIATPDHWHVPVAIAAVKAGKDIYVEKPLGMTIDEGKALRKVVRQYGAVFQHGTEQRSFRQFRHACELVRNGYLGDLTRIEVACPGGKAIGPQPAMPVPKGLDWDLWLGPAPRVPFTAARLHARWYFISDYATSGFVAGWGVHHIDMAQWALDADASGPVAIEGRATLPTEGLYDTPLTWNIDYDYANGVRVNFTDNRQNRQGVVFRGTKGWLHVDRSSIRTEPESLAGVTIRPNEVHLYQADNDDRNFIECVKSRGETCSPIEPAHRSTAVCYLGYIAILLGRKLRWDPVAEHFVNDPEADRCLTRALREPWHL